MEVKVHKYAAMTAFEYFLYTALILETGLAAFIYKVIGPEPDLLSLKIVLGILYLAFLAWGVLQLSRVHRARKQFESTVHLEPVADSEPQNETETASKPADSVRFLGLSRLQLAVVVAVFLVAVMGFTWALGRLG